MRLSFDKGKYEIIFDEHTGTLEALRHGEPWRSLTGDNLILSMAQEVEALRAASPAKKPPYANMGEYLADLEAHASPDKATLTLADCPDCKGQGGYPLCPTCENAKPTHEGETPTPETDAAEKAYKDYVIRQGDLDMKGSGCILCPPDNGWEKSRQLERRATDAETIIGRAIVNIPARKGWRTSDPNDGIKAMKSALTAAESERDGLRLAAEVAWYAMLKHAPNECAREIRICAEALAPSSETTTPAEDKDFAHVEDVARASLASLYSCMDPSVLPHVRKKIEDYINLLKAHASL